MRLVRLLITVASALYVKLFIAVGNGFGSWFGVWATVVWSWIIWGDLEDLEDEW